LTFSDQDKKQITRYSLGFGGLAFHRATKQHFQNGKLFEPTVNHIWSLIILIMSDMVVVLLLASCQNSFLHSVLQNKSLDKNDWCIGTKTVDSANACSYQGGSAKMQLLKSIPLYHHQYSMSWKATRHLIGVQSSSDVV
jgi:hypothetical protein